MARQRAAPGAPGARLGALCALLGAIAGAGPRRDPAAPSGPAPAPSRPALACARGRAGGTPSRGRARLGGGRRPAGGGRSLVGRAPARRCAAGARPALGAIGAATADLLEYKQIQRHRSLAMEAYGLWRVFWFGLALFSTSLVLVTVCLPLVPYVLLRDPHRRSLFNKISSIWATTLCSMFFRVEVVNAGNLPDEGDARKYMYVANHQSFMDILSVFSLGRPFKFISKASISWIPVVGLGMRLLGHITVDRRSQQSQVQMIRRCLLELRRGTSVFFFPEGTRTKTGRLRTFTKGAFSIAKKARVGVVPITVLGTGDIMPAGRELRLFPSRLGVKLIVHPTFTERQVQELAEADLRRLATEAVESAMPPALSEKTSISESSEAAARA